LIYINLKIFFKHLLNPIKEKKQRRGKRVEETEVRRSSGR